MDSIKFSSWVIDTTFSDLFEILTKFFDFIDIEIFPTLTSAAPTTEFIIKSSEIPYKRFSVKLRSKNNIGLAPTPICKIIFSGEDVPKSFPQNLATKTGAASVGKNFISLNWDPIPKSELNGKLKEYIIKYKVGETIGPENNRLGCYVEF